MQLADWDFARLYLAGETVAVVRAGTVADPYSGEDGPDWDTPTVNTLPVLCPVYSSTIAQSADLDTPLLVEDTITAIVPYDTDVFESDRFRVYTGPYARRSTDGLGPYARTYEIRAVRPWKNPMVGWEPGTTLTLEWGGHRG